MEQNNNYNFNSAKIYTGSSCGELRVSTPHSKSVISATNNRAKYYAELSEKYKEEARKYKDEAKNYAEKNADVTIENLEELELSLQKEIATKQPVGDYATRKELPLNVSELNNDAEYVVSSELEAVVEELSLPEQEGNNGKFLITNGSETSWTGINSFNLFDTKLMDRVLTYEETKGWALQGTYVYKEALAGSRYGYPDFYNKVLEEKEDSTATEVVLGENTITMYVNQNGHNFYDIADKEIVDSWFDKNGYAWFYGVDIENERIFLPRNNWFEQLTGNISEVGQSVEAGLPNIEGYINGVLNSGNGAFAYKDAPGSATPNASWANPVSYGYDFDASRSNPIYGNSDAVQPNSVKKLLYICVGNSVNYESVVDVVNQGVEILEQVNQGFETRVNIDATNLSENGKKLLTSYSMPDYESMITGNVNMGAWVQVTKDSFVITYGGDPYAESYFIYVSPDKTTKYTVGHRMDDVNSNTQATTFAFFVPKGWYFQNNAEGGSSYHIYPLKGAN